MNGYEKIMSMSKEDLAHSGICPSELGLKDDEELCSNFEPYEEARRNNCHQCILRALESEV